MSIRWDANDRKALRQMRRRARRIGLLRELGWWAIIIGIAYAMGLMWLALTGGIY